MDTEDAKNAGLRLKRLLHELGKSSAGLDILQVSILLRCTKPTVDSVLTLAIAAGLVSECQESEKVVYKLKQL